MSLAAMSTVRRFVSLVLLALPAGCGTAQEPLESASQTGIELFVPPAKSLYVEPQMPLGELLGRYTERMGWTLLASEPARTKLAERRCEFPARLEVPFGSVHGFVESLVRANGLLLRFEHIQAPVVLQVIDPDDKEQGDTPEHRMVVPLAEVPRWGAHPAHMITTQVPLPAGDVDDLLRGLRATLGEVARGQVTRMGDTNSALFSGTGTEVARLVRIFADVAHGPGQSDAASLVQLPQEPWIELLCAPSTGLHIERPERGDLMLKDVVEHYAQLMGWRLLFGPDTWNQLRVLKLGLALPLDVAPENVHAFVEAILNANDFVLSFACAREPVLLQIRTTNIPGPGDPRHEALLVSASDLPRWAAHSAFRVSTLIELPGVDVRTLSNTLRQSFSDQQTQQLLPLGAETLLVTGYGSEVVALATLLQRLTAAAGGVHAPPAVVPARPTGAELLVLPSQSLRIPVLENGRPPTLQVLADAYAGLMCWRVLALPDTRNQLKTLKCDFALPVEVAPEHVHEFVQGVLRANDFVLHFAHSQDPVLLGIASTNVAGKGNPRKEAMYVSPAELARWAGHPAFLVTTCLDLPGVDVRTLSNSLRQMFSDQQTQQIIPAGNTDGLIVTGFGSDIANLAIMLRSLSDAAAGARSPLPEFAAQESGIGLLVPPSKGLRLEKPQGRELKLADFFEQYTQLMGWRVLADWDTRKQLASINFAVTLPLDLPPAGVHGFAESLARENDLVLVFAHTGEPVLLQMSSTAVAGRGNPRKDAMFVHPQELPLWSEHPGFLITTTVVLPGIDVRTLSNSLRQMFSDQQTQQILPAGDTNGLILTGFANEVASIASTFGELSRGGAGMQVSSLPAPPAADRARLFPLGEGGFAIAAPNGKEATPIDVLEEFAHWSKRPLEISDDARKALVPVERKFAEPLVVRAQLTYPYVGVLLSRARCTLSPVPPDAPAKWVVDVVRSAKEIAVTDLPAVPFEELAAWNAYCATPFRTLLKLPESTDTKQLIAVMKLFSRGGLGCRVDLASERALQLCGTPLEIQATAYTILQACEPAPEKPR